MLQSLATVGRFAQHVNLVNSFTFVLLCYGHGDYTIDFVARKWSKTHKIQAKLILVLTVRSCQSYSRLTQYTDTVDQI